MHFESNEQFDEQTETPLVTSFDAQAMTWPGTQDAGYSNVAAHVLPDDPADPAASQVDHSMHDGHGRAYLVEQSDTLVHE